MGKFNLKDVTFVILYHKDSEDREQNLIAILKFLNKNFDTKIHVIESGKKEFQKLPVHVFEQIFPSGTISCLKHTFYPQETDYMKRTWLLNRGIRMSDTPLVALYDCDVFFDPEAIVAAVNVGLKENKSTLSYPYSGDFVDVNRTYIIDGLIDERESLTKESKGGCVFLNKDKYLLCGLENENYVSWCPDDVDRYERVLKLGHKIHRVDGKCYHITHQRSKNSGPHEFTEHNNKEWFKVRDMGADELREYIKTWTWARLD